MTVQWSIIAYGRAVVKNCLWSCRGQYLLYDRAVVKNCLWPWPIIAYDRAVIKNCLWPCLGHVLRDSNHSIYYCMICTGYSLLALSFMLEPFMQFGEYMSSYACNTNYHLLYMNTPNKVKTFEESFFSSADVCQHQQ